MSAYANDPREAANSLQTLLDQAQAVVPKDLRAKTPVRVGVSCVSFVRYITILSFLYEFFFFFFCLSEIGIFF